MKKFLIIFAALTLVVSCYKDINIVEVNYQIPTSTDTLQNERIASLQAQLKAMEQTQSQLETQHELIDAAVDDLKARVDELNRDLDASNQRMQELEDALRNEYSDQLARLRDEISAHIAETAANIKLLNESIAALQAKDAELQAQITALEAKLKKDIAAAYSWAQSTLGTLEAQSQMAADLAAIRIIIDELDGGLPGLETRLLKKIEDSISACESSLKTWINDKFSAYYTKAQVDALVEHLQSQISANASDIAALRDSEDALAAQLRSELEAKNAALQSQIDSLAAVLDGLKAEITAEYTAAITAAIEEFEGRMTAAIEAAVAGVNAQIESEVSALNARLDEINSRMDALQQSIADALADMAGQIDSLKGDLSELLSRVQSVSYIPSYVTGESDLYSAADGSKFTTLYFLVSPASAAAELAHVGPSVFAVKALAPATGADIAFTTLPITSVSGSADGLLSVSVDASALASPASVRAALSISDGNTDYTTDFGIAFNVKNISIRDLGAAANCFIVSSEGWYSFNGSLAGVAGKASAIAPRSAALLWSSGSMISDITLLNSGRIVFHSSATRGNSLIPAKNADGDVLWSWHIWHTQTPTVINYWVYAPVIGYYYPSALDRNLGATSASAGTDSYGLYYQWGRKDPFMPGKFSTVASSAETGTLEYAALNPTEFITSGGSDWMATSDNDLWGNGYNSLTLAEKSNNDPCPAGYRVPTADLWYGLSRATQTSGAGIYLYTDATTTSSDRSWYPYAGYLRGTNASAQQQGSYGYLHASGPSTTQGATTLLQGLRYQNRTLSRSFQGSRADGLPVRCIKE